MQRFKRILKQVFKFMFCIIYFPSTAIVPVYVFVYVYSLKNSVIYAITISFIFLIGMDIICSIIEDILGRIYKAIVSRKKEKQIKKEEIKKKNKEAIEQLENLMLKKNDYKDEIEQVEKNYLDFKEKVSQVEGELPENISEGLLSICEQIESIIAILNVDLERYYPVRHIFRIYFPEIQKMIYKFIDIAKADTLDKETIFEFMLLIKELKKYLDFVKHVIYKTDKLSLDVGIKSIVKIMETEREKGKN